MSNLLKQAAALIKTGNELMGSIWQNCETEVAATQTVCACATNLREHGEAISWLSTNALRGRQVCGTDNASGIARLVDGGYVVREVYTGNLTPPAKTAQKGGKPEVLRCTDKLLHYVIGAVGAKRR